jgi:polyisoprenyl-phosphate glycosyltransferase
MPPTYSLVVPIFNEEAVIPVLLRRLDALLETLDAEAEVILVDDGSKDTSAIVIEAKARADKRYRLIKLSRNFGHQIAITVGLDHAVGRAVIVMDADLQDPPEVALEMIAKWKEGYDVVSAERASRQGESRFKRATADLFYRLMGRLGDVSTPRNTGDFRLVDRRALDSFLAMPERDRFVRGMFAWIGFRQGTVTFDRPPRGTESSRSPTRRFALRCGPALLCPRSLSSMD